MNRALISVLSKQSVKEEEAIEVVTPGKFYKKDQKYYAIYDETEISGMEGTTTTLKISNDKVSLIRRGTIITTMEFEKDKKSISLYNTPYGTLELKINTKDLNIKMTDDGGEVFINYDMCIVGQKSQKTLLKINIKVQ